MGINKTSPGALLDVNGSMRAAYDSNTNSYFGRAAVGYSGHSDYAGFSHLHRTGSTNYSFMSHSVGWTYMNAPTNYGLCFRINNSDKMRMDTNGRLGIGTTSPQALLHIYKYSATNTAIDELLRLEKRTDDQSTSEYAEGGYIGMYSGEDGNDEKARIVFRADNSDNEEDSGRISFWTTLDSTCARKVSINK